MPECVRAFIPEGRRYATLGTDGFGRSDTRAALRAYFQVDAQSIVARTLAALGQGPVSELTGGSQNSASLHLHLDSGQQNVVSPTPSTVAIR